MAWNINLEHEMKEEVGLSGGIEAEVLALKHKSRILEQRSNPVYGSKKGHGSNSTGGLSDRV